MRRLCFLDPNFRPRSSHGSERYYRKGATGGTILQTLFQTVHAVRP